MAVVRVFFPIQCMQMPSGLLIGSRDNSNSLVCITGLMNKCTDLPSKRISSEACGIVGVWINRKSSAESDELLSSVFHQNGHKGLSVIRSEDGHLNVDSNGFNYVDQSAKVTIILYNIIQFSSSLFTNSASTSSETASHVSELQPSNVEIITHALKSHMSYTISSKSEINASLIDFSAGKTWFTRIADSLHHLIFQFVVYTVGILSCIGCLAKWQFLRNVLSLPAVVGQLKYKYDSVSWRVQRASAYNEERRKNQVCLASFVFLCILDIIVGTSIMLAVLNTGIANDAADWLLVSAETVAKKVETLLHWMMGAPAGLKLNQPLAHFLGTFFLYHIFLWKAYLQAIQPFVGAVLKCCCLTGCIGVTVQLAMVQDLLSLMTLHIYCFYVYAAKLYSLQLQALASLWRLFRGKKWNVLRKRVDSATYDIDQMFLGTLLFTVFLFLLPTTAVNYAVFALMRVIVLVMHGVIWEVVSTINSLPIYWLLLRIFKSDIISGNVYMSVQQRAPLCLKLELKPVSVGDLYSADVVNATSAATVENDGNKSWTALLGKLITGQLIYPWIERPL